MDYKTVVNEVFKQIPSVSFSIIYWDNSEQKFGNKKDSFTLIFKTETAAHRLLTEGALGFGEEYMSGNLEVLGDIEAYIKLRHHLKNVKITLKLIVAGILAKRKIPKTRDKQIAHHYDLGNDFFKLFLDQSTMSYSSGLYKSGLESLDLAQKNKLELVLSLLDIPKNSEVLDLGCGWGGFAIHAAKKHGLRVASTTLSHEQLAYCKNLVEEQKLEKQITLKYSDMLTELPDKKYDAIVVLESIEHVGRDNLESFMKGLDRLLKPGGKIFIQSTGRTRAKMPDRWILKYVFPGGYIPAQNELVNIASKARLKLIHFENDTYSYIKTLAAWIKNLEANQSTIEKMFDKRFYRLWYLWMHGAKAAFEVPSMELFRLVLEKPTWRK